MLFFKEHFILIALVALTQGSVLRDSGESYVRYKRAVDPYSYPVPNISFDEKPGKSKVVVETIKSVSPPEFAAAEGFSTSLNDIQGTNIPGGSVSYNAFEPDTKKPTTGGSSSTGFGGYSYSSGGSSTESFSGTVSPAPVGPSSTHLSGFQPSTGTIGSSAGYDTTSTVGGNKVKNNGYDGYSPKVTKKPTKLGQKPSGSKSQGNGLNGNDFNAGSANFNTPTNTGGSGGQGGMMGASYMRASSPYYNFHVMLD